MRLGDKEIERIIRSSFPAMPLEIVLGAARGADHVNQITHHDRRQQAGNGELGRSRRAGTRIWSINNCRRRTGCSCRRASKLSCLPSTRWVIESRMVPEVGQRRTPSRLAIAGGV
jgi:hypothetical protein